VALRRQILSISPWLSILITPSSKSFNLWVLYIPDSHASWNEHSFKNGEYTVRHEPWALEFLVRIYSKMCNNSESTFDNRYGFGHIIQCELNNIGINEWLNILYSTANFYDEQHFQPFAKIVISNFIRFAENLPSADRAKLYSYGLGYFHYIFKDHSNAIAYYDKALEIEPNSAYIWHNKGLTLFLREKTNNIKAANSDNWHSCCWCIGRFSSINIHIYIDNIQRHTRQYDNVCRLEGQ
jgi:tetratricopeptide (TPR) repeat protein